MANQIYALLVGINNYSEVQLRGCINDIEAIEKWLTNTYNNTGNLFIKRLTDNDADSLPTRDNIIAAFDHFAKADSQDICLFYFAGHGINLTAPKAFTDDSGSGSVQAILCMDWQRSIKGKGYIIDKELSYLIWKATIEKPGVQFIVITDCCHSGTATRSISTDEAILVRSMDILEDSPDVTAYLGYTDSYNGVKAYEIAEDGSITVRLTPHLHIAAAQDTEEAKELRLNTDNTQHGAFSYSLLKLLTDTGGKISYQQLQEEVCNLIKRLYFKPDQPDFAQQPKLNNYYRQAGYINKWFLSNDGVDTGKDAHVYYDKQYGWCIDEGLLHAVSAGDAVAVTVTNAAVKSFKIQQAGLLFSIIRAQDATDTLSDMDQKIRFYPGVVLAKKLLLSTDAKSKWQYIVNLNNPETKLDNFTVEVVCATGYNGYDYTYETGDVSKPNTLSYITYQNTTYKPAFKISITNNGSTDLFFSFAYLDTDYNINIVSMNEDQAATDFQVAGGKSQDTKRIKLQNESETAIAEYLKIFVAAKEAIPLYSLQQEAQEVTRGLATDDDDIDHYQLDDWTTVTISFQIAPKPH